VYSPSLPPSLAPSLPPRRLVMERSGLTPETLRNYARTPGVIMRKLAPSFGEEG